MTCHKRALYKRNILSMKYYSDCVLSIGPHLFFSIRAEVFSQAPPP